MQVSDEEIKEHLKPKKSLEPYVEAYNEKTQFFSTNNPDLIEEAVNNFLIEEYKCES